MTPRRTPQVIDAAAPAAALPLDITPVQPAEVVQPPMGQTIATTPTKLVIHPAQVQTIAAPPTPMTLLTLAMERGDADLDRLERLMVMQERWEGNEARKAFNAAFAAFKAETVHIIKNVAVTDGPLKGKSYADLFAAVDAATPALSKHGLSANWKITKDEPQWLEVTCILRHAAGHYEVVSMGAPPDAGGAKNAVQARASTVSYLERYTFLAITGLASKNQDDDARGGGKGADFQELPEDAFQRHLAAIRAAQDDDTLRSAYNEALKACHEKDSRTRQAFADEKNTRYRAIHATKGGTR